MKKTIEGMDKKTKIIIGVILAAFIIVNIGTHICYASQMDVLRQELQEEKDVSAQLAQQLASFKEENQSLASQINDLIAEETVVFNATIIEEQILEIEELGTVEYFYTSLGTVASDKNFKNTDLKIPFSSKMVAVAMDGVIKIGVDAELIKITTNEITKTITVTIPEARILSNEPDEETLTVYNEEEGVFNKITLEDGSLVRIDIKNKAKENALRNGLLEQARENAGEFVKCLIEAVPSIKDTYTIKIHYK